MMLVLEVIESKTFTKWIEKLKNSKARALISVKIDKLTHNLPCDVKRVGDGISELRIHYGAGYRVYFSKRNNTLLILLCGGDKSSQDNDIAKAKQLLQEWS